MVPLLGQRRVVLLTVDRWMVDNFMSFSKGGLATTGAAVIKGDHPLSLDVVPIGVWRSPQNPTVVGTRAVPLCTTAPGITGRIVWTSRTGVSTGTC